MEFVYQPAPSHRLGDYLKANLSLSSSWTHFRAAVAFIKQSGTRHLTGAVSAFAQTSHVEIVAGIDHRGTSAEGLRDLLDATAANGRVIVFHNRLPFTFHPKVYLFKSSIAAEALIGSGNLTEGGLFTNYEASLRLTLDLMDPAQAALLQSIEHVLDVWADLSSGTAHVLDEDFLVRLIALGLVPVETLSTPETGDVTMSPVTSSGDTKAHTHTDEETSLKPPDSPFTARFEPRAPSFPRPPAARGLSAGTAYPTATQTSDSELRILGVTGFLMTLQRTDVGIGQITAGTSRRSPEIFIPLAARNAVPGFWDWPEGFTPDPQRPGKFDRGVRMRLGGDVILVNMMTWPDKHDFRLRSEALRSAGNVGDILRMEKVDPAGGFEYYAEIIPQGTSQHPVYLALCRQSVRNSRKAYGYY